jgi:hypothetical protein
MVRPDARAMPTRDGCSATVDKLFSMPSNFCSKVACAALFDVKMTENSALVRAAAAKWSDKLVIGWACHRDGGCTAT